MNAKILDRVDTAHLDKQTISNGKLVIKNHSFWKGLDPNLVANFMLKHGLYVIPTTELICWLKENVVGSAIEIGAGNGAISRALGIPITDNRMQELPEVQFFYMMSGQPVIAYPDDVEKLEALEAVEKYKPDTVIGAFITHKFVDEVVGGNAYGVQEETIIEKTRRYIMIGNLDTHRLKPILKKKHDWMYFPWLITRSADQKNNRIFVWNN